MTPEDRSPEENTFRERRSAFSEDDEERPVAEEAEPVIETPAGASEEETSVVGEAPAPETGQREPAEEEETPIVDEAPGPVEPGPEADAGEGAAVDMDALDQMEIPEASFLEIVQPLEIQALQFLGVVPLTESGEKRTLPRWAKHVIDLLGLLEERTRGNLPEDEKQYLDQVLAELRMRYLKVSS